MHVYVSEVGGESSWEIVSCRAVRAYLRARGVIGQVRFQLKRTPPPFPFPFDVAGLSLFPCETTYSLFPSDQYFHLISIIPMISMISMIPSESK